MVMTGTGRKKQPLVTWYVLEWNGLDDRIDLYEAESEQEDAALVYEEVAEDLHNFSSILLMDKEKLEALFKAVDGLKRQMKGGIGAR